MPTKGKMKAGKSAEYKKVSKGRVVSKGKRSASQTNQPMEQDAKRRIGHFVGAGEPPIMK